VRTTNLPAAIAGRPYDAQLEANLGTTPYHWRVIGGRLPRGLRLTPAGKLRGVPRVRGEHTLTVRVADSSHPTMRATQMLRLRVARGHHR
jgi:hypothetical protein